MYSRGVPERILRVQEAGATAGHFTHLPVRLPGTCPHLTSRCTQRDDRRGDPIVTSHLAAPQALQDPTASTSRGSVGTPDPLEKTTCQRRRLPAAGNVAGNAGTASRPRSRSSSDRPITVDDRDHSRSELADPSPRCTPGLVVSDGVRRLPR